MTFREIYSKYFNLWRENCIIQRIFFIVQSVGLAIVILTIAYILSLPLTSNSEDPVTQLQTKIIKEFATRLIIFIITVYIVNFIIQTFLLNVFCRSSYNKGKQGMILYVILFLVAFLAIATVVSLLFLPIIISFWKDYKVEGTEN